MIGLCWVCLSITTSLKRCGEDHTKQLKLPKFLTVIMSRHELILQQSLRGPLLSRFYLVIKITWFWCWVVEKQQAAGKGLTIPFISRSVRQTFLSHVLFVILPTVGNHRIILQRNHWRTLHIFVFVTIM